jgi:hypothetical protein
VTPKERINISVPVFALREIDEHIIKLGENRSHFLYTTALKVIRGELPEVIVKKVPVKKPARHKPPVRKIRGKKKVGARKKAAGRRPTASA